MGKQYHIVTFSERLSIETMLNAGENITSIANKIGCHRATIYNEIKRGTVNGHYEALHSQTMLNNPH